MSRKLTVEEFCAVRRALAAGKRHVEIAREMGLSLWTIARIDDDPLLQMDPVNEAELPVDNGPADFESEQLRRCPGCGAMVYRWPCLACQAAVTERVPPAAEVVDMLEDMIGWDEAERGRRRDRVTEGRREGERVKGDEVGFAPCGRRRRVKRANGAYRAKLARKAG
jgi:hypothetical protein